MIARRRIGLCLALLHLTIVVPHSSAQAGTHVVPLTIDSTGSTDVTEALTRFFASVPDGSTIAFRPNGRYRIDGSLVVVDRRDLVFEGSGATFVAGAPGDRDRRHWWFHGGSNIVVRNMIVKGAHPQAGVGEEAWREDKEFQHGFHLAGVEGMELDRVTVTDVFGDFVYLGKATEGRDKNRRATRVHIHDSHFERNGRQGIAITAAHDVLIEGNFIGETRRATFDLEPPTETWRVSRVRILNNRIGDGRLLFVASKGQGPVDDILVEGNELDQRPMTVVVDPPDGMRRSSWRFIDNRTNSQHGSPQGSTMRFRRVDGIEVRGNHQPLQERRDMVLVETYESCHVVVAGNELGPHAIGQVEMHPYDCAGVPPPTTTPPVPAPAPEAGAPSAPAAPAAPAPAPGPTGPPVATSATPAPTSDVPSPVATAAPAPTTTDAPLEGREGAGEARALPAADDDEEAGRGAAAGVTATLLLVVVGGLLLRQMSLARKARAPSSSSRAPEMPSSG